MNIKKLQTTTYAITKRIQGYHLLKNPKGASPYEVNMIKMDEVMTPELDKYTSYTRISKDFSQKQPKTIVKILDIFRYMFWDENKKEIKKEKYYQHAKNNVKIYEKETEIPEQEIDSRNFDYILKKRQNGVEYIIDLVKMKFGTFDALEVPIFESISDIENRKFRLKKQDVFFKSSPSFWSVLKSNLGMKK